jgi:hypothetical protein
MHVPYRHDDFSCSVRTMMAVGVASPKAHGHEMTSTAIPNSSEKVKADSGLAAEPYQSAGTKPRRHAAYQDTIVRTESSVTVGTKTDAIVSAKFWMGVLLEAICASVTSLMIWERAVAVPTPVT